MGATWKTNYHRKVYQTQSRTNLGAHASKVTWVVFLTVFMAVAWGSPGPDLQGTTTERDSTVIKPLLVLPQIGEAEKSGPAAAQHIDKSTDPPLSSTDTVPSYQGPEILFPPDNLTVPIGSDVTLKCTAWDPADPDKRVTITWFKDGDHRIQQSTSPRIHLQQGKRKLKIDNVQWSDRGLYECMASNLYGFVRSTPGRLDVEKPVEIVRGIQDRNVSRGTLVNSTCIVEGFPEPEIFWEVNNLLYRIPGTNRAYSKQYFLYPAQRSIKLACKTLNNVSTDGVTRKKSTGFIYVTNPLSYCKTYNGYNCAPFELGNVFVNGSLDNPGGSLERILSSFVTSMEKLRIPTKCKRAFRSLLCHSAFPMCDHSDPDHLKQRNVCVEDCLAVKELLCREHWETLQSIDSRLLEVYPTFPNCSAAPFTVTDNTCARTAYFDASPSDRKTTNCIIQNGHTYVGKQNMTESGSYCQSWNQEFYQNMGYSSVAFTELANAHNYCRNPGGLDSRPWCFVRKRTTAKQYCSIPVCASEDLTSPRTTDSHMVSQQMFFPQKPDPSPRYVPPGGDVVSVDMSGFFYIIFSGMFILFILVIVIVLSIRRVRYLKRHPPYIFPRGFDIRYVPDNRMFGKNFNRSFNPLLEYLEYPRNDIIYQSDIGEGAFGRVFKATAANPSTADKTIVVAVKMLKSSASSDVAENFNREAVLMSGFNNINVIKLWGVCFVGRPLCILLEYMEKGDLQEFLQMKNPRNPQFFETEESETGLPVKLLVSFSRQAANGMVYLSDKRLVHRDVATRNCLVNNLLQVKIADFGLARYLGQEDYHLGSKEERVPVRWTAPEALWNYHFTTRSDVWSYGIFMWELFSYAEQPYVGMTLEQVFIQTQHGYQLPCPEDTPPAMFNMMTTCWRLDPESRPSFQTLNSRLTELETEFLKAARFSSTESKG